MPDKSIVTACKTLVETTGSSRSPLEVALFIGDWDAALQEMLVCDKQTLCSAFLYTPIPPQLRDRIILYSHDNPWLRICYMINTVLERKKILHTKHIADEALQNRNCAADILIHIEKDETRAQEMYRWQTHKPENE